MKNKCAFSISIVATLLMLTSHCFSASAQEQNAEVSLFDMPLEELMKIEIALPSKKPELLFDSPLSASVLSREEIQRSGALSVPEALRLVPGIIVREQSSGNFDFNIRGFDYAPSNSDITLSSNTLTLVMIDNRIIYNYYQGSTFWEMLPVSIHDVERIEVIRGPAAALYGPNAVTGVINIITRRPEKQGWSINAHLEGGNFRTKTGHLSLAYNNEDKTSMGVSANFSERDRHQSAYYEYAGDRYVADVGDVRGYQSGQPFSNPRKSYPHPDEALDLYGINAFMQYRPEDDMCFDIRGGYQDSRVQKIYVETKTPFATYDSQSAYVDILAQIRGLRAQCSVNSGDYEARGISATNYDFITVDMLVEYDISWGNLSLLPGLWYRNVVYDGSFIKGRRELRTSAFSLRAEYQVTEKLRLITAVRGDHYNHPDDLYASWQAAATYQLNEDNLLRLVYSRSHRAPFFLNTYLDYESMFIVMRGDDDLDLLTMDMFEIGWRRMLSDSVQMDVEAFFSVADDYDALIQGGQRRFAKMMVTYENIALTAEQFGITASLTYTPRRNLLLRAFATLQRTFLNDQYADFTSPEDEHDRRHRNTPTLYGGLYGNYRLAEKLNINVNAYYYTRQRVDHHVQTTHVGGKVIVNAKVNYQLTKNVSVFFNARNLLNNHSREFAFADQIMGTYLVGMDFQY